MMQFLSKNPLDSQLQTSEMDEISIINVLQKSEISSTEYEDSTPIHMLINAIKRDLKNVEEKEKQLKFKKMRLQLELQHHEQRLTREMK